MKVLKVEPSHSEIITMDDSEEWPIFHRFSHDIWENLMGESWEPVYSCEELEKAYRSYKDENYNPPFNLAINDHFLRARRDTNLPKIGLMTRESLAQRLIDQTEEQSAINQLNKELAEREHRTTDSTRDVI